MLAVSDPVVVAMITGVFAVITAGVQLVVHRDNRRDHGLTATRIGDVLTEVRGVKADVADVRADVRTLKVDVRTHEEHLDVLDGHLADYLAAEVTTRLDTLMRVAQRQHPEEF